MNTFTAAKHILIYADCRTHHVCQLIFIRMQNFIFFSLLEQAVLLRLMLQNINKNQPQPCTLWEYSCDFVDILTTYRHHTQLLSCSPWWLFVWSAKWFRDFSIDVSPSIIHSTHCALRLISCQYTEQSHLVCWYPGCSLEF